MHVHIVGNGKSGSGCWMRLNPYRRLAGESLLRSIRFRADLKDPDFDERYAGYLAGLVRASALSHVVILAHEEVYEESGRRLDFGTFHTSNQWVLELAKRHPEFLPAVSIHPARRDALDELERCLDAGAVMLKILPPSQNIDCSRPAYREFFQRMAQARLPLLAHTGGEYTVPVRDKRLFDPRLLRQPLECGVTVIAAHAATRSGPRWLERDFMADFIAMLGDYPHLFADISSLNTPNRSHGLRPCLKPQIMPRVVHGSDFPVPVSGLWARMRGLISTSDARAASAETNLIQRDYLLKRAMGFDDTVFTRAWHLLRLPTRAEEKSG